VPWHRECGCAPVSCKSIAPELLKQPIAGIGPILEKVVFSNVRLGRPGARSPHGAEDSLSAGEAVPDDDAPRLHPGHGLRFWQNKANGLIVRRQAFSFWQNKANSGSSVIASEAKQSHATRAAEIASSRFARLAMTSRRVQSKRSVLQIPCIYREPTDRARP